MLIIETKRLLLRDFERGDVAAYCTLTGDSKYQRFYSEEDCSVEKSRSLVEHFVLQSEELNRSKYQLAICLKSTGEFIGTVGLRVELNKQASVGCGVGREFQSAGYAEEAMSALLTYGFDALDIHRVYAETISDNIPAIRLCKALGMREEAKFIENRFFKGKWWSTVIMAMLKTEWCRRSSH
ncbi:GNAT family N-acetyltransferase [Saccharospirillum alexandrii]|uniref:GNAT family N-acetyltransferase n=1 Tax=Saccharospirillum alexandrii TaxID=2448477 RepID=UPI000FDC9FD5|nr:GNAT family protein [Saccharospirillum alexandrii]